MPLESFRLPSCVFIEDVSILHNNCLWFGYDNEGCVAALKSLPTLSFNAVIIPILRIVCTIISADCMLGCQPNHGWQLCFPL